MTFPKGVWDQLKGLHVEDLQKALQKDGFELEESQGATLAYYRPSDGRRVVVHYHPKKTFGAKILKGLFDDAGWDIDDFKRLKLIKKKS